MRLVWLNYDSGEWEKRLFEPRSHLPYLNPDGPHRAAYIVYRAWGHSSLSAFHMAIEDNHGDDEYEYVSS